MLIARNAGLSRKQVKALLRAGRVHDAAGERLDDAALPLTPTQLPVEIRIDSEPLTLHHRFSLLLNKPLGVITAQRDARHPTAYACLSESPLFAELRGVGRLDKDTSGLLVVAKSDRAHHGLSEQFAAHTVERRYLALCYGVPDAGDPRLRGLRGVSFESGSILKITTQLNRHRTERQKQAVSWAGGRHAVTRAKVVETFHDAASLVECQLETGRTHQIRVHMAYVGHGLVGDPVYGGARRLSARNLPQSAIDAARHFPRQALHAATLGFTHPVTSEIIRFQSDIPDDMAGLLAQMRK